MFFAMSNNRNQRSSPEFQPTTLKFGERSIDSTAVNTSRGSAEGELEVFAKENMPDWESGTLFYCAYRLWGSPLSTMPTITNMP